MINLQYANDIAEAIQAYSKTVESTKDEDSSADYKRLIVAAGEVVDAIRAGDVARIRKAILGFSRVASDSYATQPLEFTPLANQIAHAESAVMETSE